MRSIFLFAVLCICIEYQLSGCTHAKKTEKIQADKIQGTWYLNQWDLYNKLYFDDDSTAVFDNHIDTLYRFTYKVKSNELVLRDANGNISHNTILELQNDTLIFKNLLVKKDIQRYSRIEYKR
jgi:hypothetical protein